MAQQINSQVYELMYLIHLNLEDWLRAGYHLKTTTGAVLLKIDQVDRAIQEGRLAVPPAACLAGLSTTGCCRHAEEDLQ